MTFDVEYKINILRNGAFYAEAGFSTEDPPRIDFQNDSTICGSMQCTLTSIDDIRVGIDELQPMIRRDGAWTSVGVYRVTSCVKTGSDTSTRYKIEAYDRSWVLEQRKTEDLYFIAAGTPYLTKAQQIIQSAGLNLIFTQKPINASIPESAALGVDKEWRSGTSYLTIINDLLTELGYRPLWFDSIGAARIEPYAAPSPERIKHTYSTHDMTLPGIGDEYSAEEDFFNAPNKFIVICNDPELGTFRGVAINSAVYSKKSTVNRGMVITEITEVDAAYNSAACEELAKKRRDESMMSQQVITFHTLNESGHGLGDVIALDFEPLTGLYTETGWVLIMKPGSLMKHTAQRTIT